MGLGEGVAPSASTDMIARIVRTEERSRATSYMFGGLHVGSLLGLLVAPALIEKFGWQTVRPVRASATRAHAGYGRPMARARTWRELDAPRLAGGLAGIAGYVVRFQHCSAPKHLSHLRPCSKCQFC